MRWSSVPLMLASGLTLACAKPTSERHTSSGALDEQVGGGEVERDRGDGPAPTSCPDSSPRQVRYASTLAKPQRTKLRPELGDRRCLADGLAALEADIACAQAYNRAAWERAFAERGLTPFEPELVEAWIDEAITPGSIHPHPDDPARRLVFLGNEHYGNCSGTSVHTTVGPGLSLARNAASEVVIVRPKPSVEQRDYPICSCFPGCGAMMGPGPQRFAELGANEAVAEPVELVYPAIAISTHAVDTETCCCAP
jgi:hypothetical protein